MPPTSIIVFVAFLAVPMHTKESGKKSTDGLTLINTSIIFVMMYRHSAIRCIGPETIFVIPTCDPRDLVYRMPESLAAPGGRLWASPRGLSDTRRRLVVRMTIGDGEPHQVDSGGEGGCLWWPPRGL